MQVEGQERLANRIGSEQDQNCDPEDLVLLSDFGTIDKSYSRQYGTVISAPWNVSDHAMQHKQRVFFTGSNLGETSTQAAKYSAQLVCAFGKTICLRDTTRNCFMGHNSP